MKSHTFHNDGIVVLCILRIQYNIVDIEYLLLFPKKGNILHNYYWKRLYTFIDSYLLASILMEEIQVLHK